MGSLNPFSKPKVPAPAPIQKFEPIAVPTEKDNQADISRAQAEEKERRKTQRGRAATMLTGGKGVMGDDSSGLATKTLLGG